MTKEIKYRIRVAYIDEIYAQKPQETIFYIMNGAKDSWDNYDECKKFFDKMVRTNEKLIQANKTNTFYELNLIKDTGYTSKILEHYRYD